VPCQELLVCAKQGEQVFVEEDVGLVCHMGEDCALEPEGEIARQRDSSHPLVRGLVVLEL